MEKKKVVIAAKPVTKTARLTVDDYLVKARSLLGVKSKENEVIELASRAIEQKATYAAYDYRAYANDDLGDRVGTLQDLDSALAIEARKQNAYYFRGILKYKTGDKNGSISDFDQAIAIDPQFSQAYSNRGVVYRSMGQTKIAFSDYSRAIAINGRNANAYRNRGSVWGRIGDYAGALDDFSQAVELNPNDAYALACRGLFWFWHALAAVVARIWAALEPWVCVRPRTCNGNIAWNSDQQKQKLVIAFRGLIDRL